MLTPPLLAAVETAAVQAVVLAHGDAFVRHATDCRAPAPLALDTWACDVAPALAAELDEAPGSLPASESFVAILAAGWARLRADVAAALAFDKSAFHAGAPGRRTAPPTASRPAYRWWHHYGALHDAPRAEEWPGILAAARGAAPPATTAQLAFATLFGTLRPAVLGTVPAEETNWRRWELAPVAYFAARAQHAHLMDAVLVRMTRFATADVMDVVEAAAVAGTPAALRFALSLRRAQALTHEEEQADPKNGFNHPYTAAGASLQASHNVAGLHYLLEHTPERGDAALRFLVTAGYVSEAGRSGAAALRASVELLGGHFKRGELEGLELSSWAVQVACAHGHVAVLEWLAATGRLLPPFGHNVLGAACFEAALHAAPAVYDALERLGATATLTPAMVRRVLLWMHEFDRVEGWCNNPCRADIGVLRRLVAHAPAVQSDPAILAAAQRHPGWPALLADAGFAV